MSTKKSKTLSFRFRGSCLSILGVGHVSAQMSVRGSWKLEAGSWKLEAGSWKLEAVEMHACPVHMEE
eukprot:scaffold585_cov161-Skeletonema_marinoi.AAC.4